MTERQRATVGVDSFSYSLSKSSSVISSELSSKSSSSISEVLSIISDLRGAAGFSCFCLLVRDLRRFFDDLLLLFLGKLCYLISSGNAHRTAFNGIFNLGNGIMLDVFDLPDLSGGDTENLSNIIPYTPFKGLHLGF